VILAAAASLECGGKILRDAAFVRAILNTQPKSGVAEYLAAALQRHDDT